MGFRSWLNVEDLELRHERPWWTAGNTVALTDQPGQHFGESATSLAYKVPTAVRCMELLATNIAQFTTEAWRDDVRLDDQPRLLRRSDPFTEQFWFIYHTVIDMLCEGTAAWEHTSVDEFGRPLTLRRIPAEELLIRWNPNRPVAQAKLEGDRQILYGGTPIDPATLTLIPMLYVPGEASGLGPVQAGRPVSAGQVAADDLVASNFRDGEYPSGVIEAPTNLSETQADRILEGFMTRRLKFGKRAPAVMSGGAQWKQTQINARDAQWIEARQWGAAEFSRLFGIPAGMLNLPIPGGSQVTYNNSVGQRTELLHTGLSPIIARIEAAFSGLLPSTQDAHMDTTDYLPPMEAIVPSHADSHGPPADTPRTPQPQTPEAPETTGGNTRVF